MQVENLPQRKIKDDREKPKRSNWIRIAITGVIALGLGTFLLSGGLPSAASTPAPETETLPPFTLIPTMTALSTITSVPINLETSLTLHFRDENAIADQAYLEVNRVPAPPTGNNYEVWLFNSRERISLGILTLDTSGRGELTFTNEEGINLITKFDQVEITLEPEEDTDPAPSDQIAYNFSFPSEGVAHLRSLLSSFPVAPEKIALIQGLYADIQNINELAGEMDTAYVTGDEILTRRSAEAIINLIVGVQSLDYKDWDGDGQITDDSTGYGLNLNGSNLGYLGALYTETNEAIKSANTSQPIRENGEHLKDSLQNLAQWTPQLQEVVLAILEAPTGTDLKGKTLDVVILANQLLNGLDLNGNGIVEGEIGEGGALSAHVFAYAMADMPLVSTGLVPDIDSGSPLNAIVGLTPIGGDGGGGGSDGSVSSPTQAPPTQVPPTQAPPTQHIPPGQTKTDKPPNTKKPPTNTPKLKSK